MPDNDEEFPEFELFESLMETWQDEPIPVCDTSNPEMCEACD